MCYAGSTSVRCVGMESLEARRHFAVTPVDRPNVSVTFTREGLESLPLGSRDFANITLANVGTARAKGKVEFELFASRDKKLDAGDRLLMEAIRNINVVSGGSTTKRFEYMYPSNLAAGTYRLITRVKPQFAEMNLANNSYRLPGVLTLTKPGAGASKVDYSVDFASTLPMSIPFGVKNEVLVTLRNNGTADSTKPVSVGLYASPDDVFGNGNDIRLSGTTFGGRLKAKQKTELDLSFTTPSDFITGLYHVAIRADEGNAYKEANEIDNIRVSGAKYHF